MTSIVLKVLLKRNQPSKLEMEQRSRKLIIITNVTTKQHT